VSSRVIVAIRVAATPQRAFDAFTAEIGRWWRPNRLFAFTPRIPGLISFEAGERGRLIETLPSGQIFEIGRVFVWNPPLHLAFGWRQATFDPSQATRVEVRFEPVGDETRVTVEHHGWDTVPDAHVAPRLREFFVSAPSCRVVAGAVIVVQGVAMTETPSPERKPRAAAFGFIYASAAINAVSFGIMIPILPNLIKQMSGGDTASASEWNVLFAATWGLMQFFVGPILGMLSDRYGRRPVLLISIFGLFIDFLFMAFAPTLWWLFVGRILNGITAGSFSTANAYVADITQPQDRAKYFGIMGSAFGFGFVIGPTIGGILGEHNLRLPFIAAAGLCLINGLYGLLVLPESLKPELRTKHMIWRRADPLSSFRFLHEHGQLMGLAAVGFLFQFSQNVLPSIFVLYTGQRYGWTPKILGFTFMASGISQILVQVLLVGRVVKRVGERGAVLIGAGFGAAGFLVYALAPTGVIYLAAIPLFAMVGFLQPGVMGLMSRRVEPQAQGRLQGVNQSFMGVSSIFGPPLYGLTFAWSVRHPGTPPGLAILIAAALLMLAFVIALWTARPVMDAAAPAPA